MHTVGTQNIISVQSILRELPADEIEEDGLIYVHKSNKKATILLTLSPEQVELDPSDEYDENDNTNENNPNMQYIPTQHLDWNIEWNNDDSDVETKTKHEDVDTENKNQQTTAKSNSMDTLD
jgi:hypothetical protein